MGSDEVIIDTLLDAAGWRKGALLVVFVSAKHVSGSGCVCLDTEWCREVRAVHSTRHHVTLFKNKSRVLMITSVYWQLR